MLVIILLGLYESSELNSEIEIQYISFNTNPGKEAVITWTCSFIDAEWKPTHSQHFTAKSKPVTMRLFSQIAISKTGFKQFRMRF